MAKSKIARFTHLIAIVVGIICLVNVLGYLFNADILLKYGLYISFTMFFLTTTACWGTAKFESLENEKNKVELEKARIESEIKAMLNFAPVGIAQAIPETARFIRVNPKLCEMTGYSELELLNLSFRELIVSNDDNNIWSDDELAIFRQKGVFDFEKRHRRKDGSIFWARITGALLQGENDNPTSSLAIIQDVTEQRQRQTMQVIAQKAAEDANKMKTIFLANMSHEIRTPISAVMGYSSLLLNEHISAENIKSYIAIIQRNGQALSRLIDDILDISKIEAGIVDIEKSIFSLADFIADVEAVMRPRAENKGIKLIFSNDNQLPKHIKTDQLRLKQMLTNVLGNSIKFTDKGSVSVFVKAISKGAQCQLTFLVQDTGVGISDRQKENLFKPFSRIDNSLSRRYGGTGLGLTLSKHFAKVMGGDIELVESVLGQGTIFKISILVEEITEVDTADNIIKENKEEINHPRPGLLNGICVLIIDDSCDSQQLFKIILEKCGANVESAACAEEGIDKALKNNFHVILMDIQLPGIDGYEATRLLRKNGYKKPIVALSAHAMREAQRLSLDAGCDYHLAKPVPNEELIDVVARYS
ncbi:MAG: hypothetical protein A2Z20_02385 [Bdellovibrionales bacterium RBG_16_40_8]|nr:MAG: hypothetical protein A2Z20_02385 [Bdellovibrionales bacterium RBG_16_40_8]